MASPEDYFEPIVGRSGLANMCGIIVHNGMIDLDYWGVVGIVLFSLSNEEDTVEAGNCSAQLIIEWCFMPKFVKVCKCVDEKTEGDEKGFGSPGVWWYVL